MYLSLTQYATKHNLSRQRIFQYIKENRIEGVVKIGNIWAIPKDAKLPVKSNGRPKLKG